MLKSSVKSRCSLFWAKCRILKFPTIQIKTIVSKNWRNTIYWKTVCCTLHQKPKMTRSFTSLCITNAICLTSLWILIALGIHVAKIQINQEMTTISKSLIWLGIVLDTAVCFTEFMKVWLKAQAPPVWFYLLSVCRYLTYISATVVIYLSAGGAPGMKRWESNTIILLLIYYGVLRIYQAIVMCFMNKEMTDEVDGIIIPVAYPVGPTGKKATAGA